MAFTAEDMKSKLERAVPLRALFRTDTVDKQEGQLHHDDMTAVTKEVLDARLETIETRMDGRLANMETKMDVKFAGVDAKFAELRTDMHKGFADMTKWIVGTVIGVAAVSITIMTFVLNNATPKAPASPAAQPAPIVIYAQPGQTAPPQAPAGSASK